MLSKQFIIYLAITVPAFVATVVALEMAGLGAIWGVAAGIWLGELADFLINWLREWQEAEQTVAEVSPDA